MKTATIVTLAFFISVQAIFSKGLDHVTTIEDAIQLATAEEELIFIKYGREACGNCKWLHGLLDNKKVRIRGMVFANIDCDSSEAKVFKQK